MSSTDQARALWVALMGYPITTPRIVRLRIKARRRYLRRAGQPATKV